MIKNHPLYTWTIIYSEEVESAVAIARELAAAQQCQSFAQQHGGIDYDKLFKDEEFGARPESLFTGGDLPEDKMVSLGGKLNKVEWYRPQQIAPDVGLVGFTRPYKPPEEGGEE